MKKIFALIIGVLLTFSAISVMASVDLPQVYVRSNQGATVNEEEDSIGQIEQGQYRHISDEILVKFKEDSAPFRVIKVQKKQAEAQARVFKKMATVEFAEPNYIVEAFWAPNDSLYSYQWHFDNASYGGIHAEGAWDTLGAPGNPGSGVIVAIVDTGIAYENYKKGGKRYYRAPDLGNTCFVSGYDFVENDTHPNDDNSHGTHVAGTVAQSTNNSLGVAGLAFKTCLMPVKVLNKSGSGTSASVANGIIYATDNGAKVINLSLGSSAPSSAIENAVNYAYSQGVVVVAAAGNDGQANISYPARYEKVIAVGATRYDETRAPYSNHGAGLDIVAPGGDSLVDQNGDGFGDGVLQQTFNPYSKNTSDFSYWFFDGTSMATPHVSATVALILSHGNAVLVDDVRLALRESADDLGPAGWDGDFGYGLLNASQALLWATTTLPTAPTSPAPDPTPLPTMHIGDISMAYTQRGNRCRVETEVLVRDDSESALSGADVNGDWSGDYTATVSGITDASGIAKIQTPWVYGCGAFTFTVSSLAKTGYIYDPSQNTKISESIVTSSKR